MNEIICPHCNKAFKIDEAGYASIVQQIRDREFQKALAERLDAHQREAKSALMLAEEQAKAQLAKVASDKELEIQSLKGQLDLAATADALRLKEATAALERERDELRRSSELATLEHQLREKSLTERLTAQLKDRDDLIERLRDLKAKLSIKMLGETLEQHCEIAFEQLRATGFRGCVFEKDNDASGGSKGDYVFRDMAAPGVEAVSIMFEMKNEGDMTATKKLNEHFLEKLDKDRKAKGCEYAVLVSMLERDNELYNGGIVDVSHLYPKMYVVRPQFFIPIITLLRNAAQNSLKYKTELAEYRSQHVDITTFETNLAAFKEAFGKNFELAQRHFETAIQAIDKSIADLTKTKDALVSSERQLRLANDKAQDVSIKKLTKGSPSVAKRFEDLRASRQDGINGPEGQESGT